MDKEKISFLIKPFQALKKRNPLHHHQTEYEMYLDFNWMRSDEEDNKFCPNCYSHLVNSSEDKYSCPNCGFQYLDR